MPQTERLYNALERLHNALERLCNTLVTLQYYRVPLP